MKERTIVFAMLCCILLGCRHEPEDNSPTIFKIPKIVNTQFADTDTVSPQLFGAEYITPRYPTFVGKYEFQDTIDINLFLNDTSYRDDYIWGIKQLINPDSLDVNGFELVVDYETTIKYCRHPETKLLNQGYYPVFFVNSTKTDKLFTSRSEHIFGIQEAIDTAANRPWQPIEAWGLHFCGAGAWGLIVHPGEFAVVLMNKYEGDFETSLRVRFQLEHSIYVSKPFTGTINESQFKIKPDSFIEKELQNTNGEAASWLFYGSPIDRKKWAGE